MKFIIYFISAFLMVVSFSGCSSEESNKITNANLDVCTNPQCTCPKPCQCGSSCRCGMNGNPTDLKNK